MTRTERWAAGLLAMLVVGAIVVPAVARHDPLAIDDVLSARLVGPFSTDEAGRFHLLGTDRFGGDLVVRMMLASSSGLLLHERDLDEPLMGVVRGSLQGRLGESGRDRGTFLEDRVALSRDA